MPDKDDSSSESSTSTEHPPLEQWVPNPAHKYIHDVRDIDPMSGSGTPNLLDKTKANIALWTTFRWCLWKDLYRRGNVWKTLYVNSD